MVEKMHEYALNLSWDELSLFEERLLHRGLRLDVGRNQAL